MLTAIVSYQRKPDVPGVLDPAIRQFLDHIVEKETRESVMDKLVAFDRGQVELKAGTILSGEWNGITHRRLPRAFGVEQLRELPVEWGR
jgi:hypothetical protein